ncbi:CGNR zinc finger domain-containing protein [Longispora sp. K20-0274]|uniref:CGNR zinc finger domain-containing protein n=1 Tax=Longispora sp. K20-0274 TaxID=3088255 RepID=UPI00399AFB83
MDFDQYAQTAVDLVNAPLGDMDALVAFFDGHPWRQSKLAERDLVAMRRAQKRLRGVFEAGTAGNDPEAVTELNALLQAHPMQPRISGHDSTDWHMHVTGRGEAVSAEYLAGAVWGLSVWLCEHGSARFGVCADERCGNVYLDTSSNCCRRFCSERCATRSHVAAHRARKKAELQAQQLPPGAVEAARQVPVTAAAVEAAR